MNSTLPNQSGPPSVEVLEAEIAQLKLELRLLNKHVQQLEAWSKEGERLLYQRRHPGIMFTIGAWWADRPWRKK